MSIASSGGGGGAITDHAGGGRGLVTLWVATDLYGKKCNRGFVFKETPPLDVLINVVESQFDMIARGERPPGYPDVAFEAQSLQAFDALTNAWVDVHSSQQLCAGAQLYCFQPVSIWHNDVQEGLPEGTQIVSWQTANGRMSRHPTDTGIPPSLSERIRSTFWEVDHKRKGHLTLPDVQRAFQSCEIEVLSFPVDELFQLMDADGDGRVSYEEWTVFALTPCNMDLVSALYYRCKDLWVFRRRGLAASGGGGGDTSMGSLGYDRRGSSTGLRSVAAEPSNTVCAPRLQSAAQQHQMAIAQYESLRAEAVAARQRADELARREQATYEMLYGAA